jgi:hypothetical protein
MDFSKLSQNDRMASGAAVVVILAGLISNWGSLFWISILAAIVALIVIFLPQLSPSTALPGSKGSLLVASGGVAGLFGVIEVLRYLGYIGKYFGDFGTLMFLIAVIAALVLAWTGWQAFQAEGGKFQIGAAAPPTTPPPSNPPPSSPPPSAPPPSSPPPSAPPPSS